MIDMSVWRRAIVLGAVAMIMTGCHGLLDVNDPTHTSDDAIANASGANARRLAASIYFSNFAGSSSVIGDVAYFTDEWTYDVPANDNTLTNRSALLDQRNGEALQALGGTDQHLGSLDAAFIQANLAIPAVRLYTPDSLRGDFLAQLYAIRGWSVVQMAEDICSGFPINDVVDNRAIYSGPVATDSALVLANIQLDSAIKYVRDSTRFITLARVTKGRALLDQGKYAEAASVVAPVLTTSIYATERNNQITVFDRWCMGCEMTAVSNNEGGNGLPFGSAADPRVPAFVQGPRNTNAADTLYYTTLGSHDNDRTVLASGIEARLIQAEAALHSNQNWKAILDSLRITVGLDTLVDPGTTDARVDLLYRERAFWLFMTGRRLGDMRRLIKNYNRSPESVFPTGPYPGGTGGSYGSSTSIPFMLAEQQRYNPYITAACSSM